MATAKLRLLSGEDGQRRRGSRLGTLGQVSNLTPQGLAGAILLFSALPIFIIYPFIQRYFLTGLTLGAVKE